jgi:hypothetical protein
MTADVIPALKDILLADSTVSDLVVKRIGMEVPEADAENMPVAAIVLKPSGGPGNGGYQTTGKKRVDVICYGESLEDSWAVYLAAEAALNAIKRNVSQRVLVHSADVQAKGSTARDPVKKWPVTYSSWLVLASEVEAA